MKNHAIRSPVVMGIAGAILGTVAARLIRGATAKQRKERIEWQPAAGAEGDYEEYTTESPGLKERAASLKDDVRDKAADLKDRAASMVDDVRERAVQGVADVRERLPSVEQLRGSAEGAYRFVTEEQPVLGGVLAMGVGMALGFLLPVTEREEQLIQPLKDRAAENLGHLDDKVRQLADKLDEKIGGQPQGAQQDEEPPQANPFGASQSRPFPSA